LHNNHLGALGGSSASLPETLQGLWKALLGEEKPRQMLMLLSLLVLLLHIWILLWLLRPVEAITPAQPLVMEVSMIAISAPKPAVAPPQAAPPPPEKKPLPPKKTPPKPVVKKPPPVVQKSPDFAPSEPVAEPQPVVQPTTSSSSTSEATTNKVAPSTNAEQFTEANFRANYAHNPKPDYPTIAKSRGWQGKVMLRVQVSAEGLSDAVRVDQSSGHEMLDESAIEAVKKWRFIPAKRGETAVASSVIVPIIFTLRN